jgi:hypothetical protein
MRAAAAALVLPRSTVSRRLAEIERQAGAPSSSEQRAASHSRTSAPGLPGKAATSQASFDRAEEPMFQSTEEPSGLLRVAAAPVLGEEVLPVIVQTLPERHPSPSYWMATPLYVAHAGANPPSPKVQAFIALARTVTIEENSIPPHA